MENATKALLIAGSILIAILLIAMGVRVFNSTSGTTDQIEGTMQTTEVATFNSKFMPYIGTNISKSKVQSLINLVIANNNKSNNKVKISYGAPSTISNAETNLDLKRVMEAVSSSAKNTFTVRSIGSEDEIKAANGRIIKIQIY